MGSYVLLDGVSALFDVSVDCFEAALLQYILRSWVRPRIVATSFWFVNYRHAVSRSDMEPFELLQCGSCNVPSLAPI